MYLPFYRLSAEPFLLTPDHRFYFDSAVHSQAMAHLVYGVNRGEGFIIITGEVGAGKTTLVKQLCACVDPRRVVAAHVVTTMVSGGDLLRLVLAAFGIPDIPPDKAGMLLRLKTFFEQMHRKGRRALLLVDEAQNLAMEALEELRMISNFQIGTTAPFQTFLIGQPQFRNIIAHQDLEQLRQRVITSYHLGPMGKEEVGNYMTHRLSKVGWRNDPEFSPCAIDAMFRETGGVPRRINTLASRMLLYGFLEKQHRFMGSDVERVAADLQAEMPIGGAPILSVPNAVANDSEIQDRINRIEKRLGNQDENVQAAIATLREFVRFATQDRKNSLGG